MTGTITIRSRTMLAGNTRVNLVTCLACVAFLFYGERISAQAFYRKVQMAQVDIGFGGHYRKVKEVNKSDSLDGKLKTTKWLSNSYGFHYEYGIKEWRRQGSIGVGGYIGMRKVDARSPNDTSPIRFREIWLRYYQIAGEAKYHMYTKNRFDPYFGVMLGMQFREYYRINIGSALPIVDPQKRNAKLTFLGQVSIGTRYYVYNNISLFAEAGFGVYYLKAGMNVIVVP